MKVPFLDLKLQYEMLRDDILRHFDEICLNSSFVLGPAVGDFESSFAGFLESKHTVGLANGTESITAALRSLGIGPEDEVIIPAHTFIATAIGILSSGARPVLVDISEETYLINYDQIEGAITPKTKAICPVHLYGRSCDMNRILEIARRHSLAVVEDAAQAHGARWNGKRVGTFGELGSFSFYPGKNLGAYGDGGAIATDSTQLAESVRAIRNYGSKVKYQHPIRGTNCRLDSLQAAVLSTKLPHLELWNRKRYAAAQRYCSLLGDLHQAGRVRLPQLPQQEEHVFHLFVIQVDNRDVVMEKLSLRGVQTGIHYPMPFYLQGGCRELGYSTGDFPITERISGRILSLPIFPEITDEQLEYVAQVLYEVMA